MQRRPRCEFRNVGLDVNKMIRITHDTLVAEGMLQKAEECMKEVNQARSLGKVFGIINKYVYTSSDLDDYLAERCRGRNISLVETGCNL